jgi:hypothetical protein
MGVETLTLVNPIHASRHKNGGADVIRLEELGLPLGSLNLNFQKIVNLPTPTAAGDAASKSYVDGALEILVYNVKNHGAVGDGITDDTTAILNTIALVSDTNGGIVYFPPGIYLCNTVIAGVILKIANKQQLTLCGAGKSAILRTTTATATDFLRLETCTRSTVRDLFIQVSGTANITNAFPITTSDPGSAHQPFVENVTIYNMSRTYRAIYDVATTTGSAVVISATAAFAAGDVGGACGVNQSVGPLNTTISSRSTITGTVSNAGTAITAVQTTLPLTAPLSGVPNSSYTIKVDTEIMLVTAGFQTSTLTVKRAYGSASSVAATHVDASTVTTYTATLGAAATATKIPTVMYVQTPGSAVMVNGIVLGGDHPGSSSLDVASVSLIGCTVSGAIGAAFQAGNGTAGNVLANYATGCEASLSLYGLFLNGGGLGVRGGNFSTNGIDVKIGQYSSQPVTVQLRSENSGMLYECSLSTTAAMPISIRDTNADVFYSPDGVVVRQQGNASLTLDTVQLLSWQQGQGVQIVCNSSSNTQPAALFAINVVTNGGNTNVMPTFSGTTRVYSFGGGRINSTGQLIPNFDAQRLDGPVIPSASTQTLSTAGAVTIDATQGNAIITLQANATSSSITGPTIGQEMSITWVQDATGGRTYAWPTNCKGAGALPTTDTASKRTTATFRYDGVNWNEICGRAAGVG